MRLAALALIELGIAARGEAQLARRGETIVVSAVAGTKRLPALAFDAAHGRWLVVWSLLPSTWRARARGPSSPRWCRSRSRPL